jgi:hypothetical protein
VRIVITSSVQDLRRGNYKGLDVRTQSTGKTMAQHRIDARGYMLACTDDQLYGVIEKEKARVKGAPLGEVARVSRIMLDEARIELRRRGLT